ncbi:splicing factor, CC1-like family domain-containing protein [Cryptosporidium muris RN66]|uniref:Splicing factor, CC1-like family domain-containing protein n=1 Tax=Cryptosporidium muris (strain RN66) TaxID=441375 RepID=B6ACC4_CRYMR|nr:splicing factor, CC1-like family domain-containing protein [Cryptosporidium muris RN66]EEA06180.1 splicing factor, CC1-like family domain-containing protein [Cryptosporidium muris RN66]|eukprot:XP_002140529.1 splicing factor, CC1-like family domain-containing protein [Cryptosporidium muris RN66]
MHNLQSMRKNKRYRSRSHSLLDSVDNNSFGDSIECKRRFNKCENFVRDTSGYSKYSKSHRHYRDHAEVDHSSEEEDFLRRKKNYYKQNEKKVKNYNSNDDKYTKYRFRSKESDCSEGSYEGNRGSFEYNHFKYKRDYKLKYYRDSKYDNRTTTYNHWDSSDIYKGNNNGKKERYKSEFDASKVAELNRVKRDLEVSSRDDLTVLVLNLNLNAAEYDVYEFFAAHAGNVRDIRIIRDQRSGRSKGVCYVEFYTAESVIKALKLSGQSIMNSPVTIQASQAEKNRAAKLAKLQELEAEIVPLKLYVGGLVDHLSKLTEDEINKLFRTFGPIKSVEIPRDPHTDKHQGFAYVTFQKTIDGHEAMRALNNYEIAGQRITVALSVDTPTNNSIGSTSSINVMSYAPSISIDLYGDTEKLEDVDGGLLSGASSRSILMKKLQEREFGRTETQLIPQDEILKTSSRCLVLGNMFTREEILDSKGDIDIITLEEIEKDVESECKKYGEVLECRIDHKKCDGKVWIKYKEAIYAKKASQAFKGRFFGGRPVQIDLVSEDTFPII